MKKKMKLLVLMTAFMLLLVSCGMESDDWGITNSINKTEKADSSYDVKYEYAMDGEWGAAESVGSSSETVSEGLTAGGEILTGEKLVYTCELYMQTLNYDTCVRTIKDNISSFGGIIESETENDSAYRWYYENYVKTGGTRCLDLTVRIPSGNYYAFLETLDGSGKIISKSSYVENISRQYYETGAMIESLEIQQDRLLAMMEQTTSIEDMITIEERLSEVQYQLSIYKNRLSSMDTDVEYSTVTISVEEVMEYSQEKPPVKTSTFGDRLLNTLRETWEFFLDMLEGMLFLCIRLLPVALIVGVIVLIVRLCILAHKKKKARKMQNMQNMQNIQNVRNGE